LVYILMLMTNDKKYPTLTIRLNTRLEKAIIEKAKKNGVSRAGIVKDALHQYFNDLDKVQ
jgi:predicted HicB family RNase H-like nuclease